MAKNSFDININLKGFPKAHQQLNKTKDGMERMRESTSGLRRQVGALRNNILLFSFAVGGAAVVVNKFVSAAAGFESVRARLVGLTGSVEEGNKAFDRFNAIAGTTPFALLDVVNAGAQLEAFGVNSKATLSAVTDLAAYMNTTAVDAANALGRAFAGGVGAADILRDKGIRQVIEDSQGIEDITKLTLPEFRSALINALTDPDGRIAGSAARLSKTYLGAVSNMKDAVVTFQSTIGEILLPTLTKAVIAAEKFVRGFNKKRILEFGSALVIVTGVYGAYRLKVLLATGAQLKFNLAMRRTLKGLGMLVAVTAVDWGLRQVGVFEDMDKALKDLNKEVEDAKEDEDNYKKSLEESAKASVVLEEETKGITKSLASKSMQLTLQAMALDGADTKTLALIESGGKLSKQDFIHIDNIERMTAAINKLNEENKIREEREKTLKMRTDLGIELNDKQIDQLYLYKTAQESSTEALSENVAKEQLRLDTINSLEEALNLQNISTETLRTNLDLSTVSFDQSTSSIQLAEGVTVSFGKENFKLAQEILSSAQMTQLYNELIKEKQATEESANEATKVQSDLQKTFESILRKTTEGEIAHLNALILKIETNNQLIATDKERTIVLEELKNKIKELEEGGDLDDLGKSADKMANGILAASRAMVSLRDNTELTQGQILQTIGSMMMLFPGMQVPGALLQSAGMFVGHTGGLIKDNGIQRFATGGMVQGQDNVPIMAQAGEFVMRREAVQNIGVQNLADMNRSGQGGGVTVNIHGNMIGNDEFIRETLIPGITKASRQGLA